MNNKEQQRDYLLKVIEANQQLKNQLKRSEMEREIEESMLMLIVGPKSYFRFQPARIERYKFIQQLESDFPAKLLCKLL